MKNEQQSNLILFGYKSSGKTYFGKLLAQELGCGFIDTDGLVEDLYTKHFHEKLSCRHISLKIGEEGFRHLERRVVDSLRPQIDSVIAVGGGTVLNPDSCNILDRLGKLVYLEADREVIKRRIFSRELPSFLDPHDPKRSFEKTYEERKLIYAQLGRFKVNIQGKTDRQVLDELRMVFSAA